jgi:hypothetical protein
VHARNDHAALAKFHPLARTGEIALDDPDVITFVMTILADGQCLETKAVLG